MVLFQITETKGGQYHNSERVYKTHQSKRTY